MEGHTHLHSDQNVYVSSACRFNLTGVARPLYYNLTETRTGHYYDYKNAYQVDVEGTQKIIPVTQAKKELLEIVKEMTEEDITVAVTKNGVPVSVLMSADRYEGPLETIEILADRSVVKALSRSSKELQTGKVLTHEEAWAEP